MRPVPSVMLSGGAVKVAEDFKYLGSWVQQDWGMSKEIEARRAKGLGVFQTFDKVWSSSKLRLKDKMAVYNTFVLPHFVYGAETWNCTANHLSRLETAHSACLRRIMGVRIADRHTLQHIRSTCESQPLELMITKRTMQWLGHVMRMPVGRYPAMVFGCKPVGGRRRVGGPRATYRHTYKCMLTTVGVTSHEAWWQEAYAAAQDRDSWRAMVKGLVIPAPYSSASQGTRILPDRAEKHKEKRYVF